MSRPADRPKRFELFRDHARSGVPALAALVVGLLLTGVLVASSEKVNLDLLRQRFKFVANERFSRTQDRFDTQALKLDGLRRFFFYSEEVTRAEFNGYIPPLLDDTQGYSWIPLVSDNQREAFEARVRAEGLGDYSIREFNGQGDLQPAARRPRYLPVAYNLSVGHVPQPMGFDLLSSVARRETLLKAWQIRAMTISPIITLIGLDPDYNRGMLLVAPVFTDLLAARDPAPEDNLRGFVLAVISLRQLMEEGASAAAEESLSVEFVEQADEPGNAGVAEKMAYQSTSVAARSDLLASQVISLADRHYVMTVRPTDAFMRTNQSSSLLLMVFGCLLSLLLSVLLYTLISQRQRAIVLVEQRTRELQARSRELRRTGNQLRGILNAATQVAIIATDRQGIIQTFNVGAERMLGYRSSDVVGEHALHHLHLYQELLEQTVECRARTGEKIPATLAMLMAPGEAGAAEGTAHREREWTLVREDGSQLTVNMLVTPVHDENEEPIGYLAICIDVTERNRVHNALEARDHLLEKLSAHVPGMIFQFQQRQDGSASFPYVSAGAEQVFEVTPHALNQSADGAFARIHPDDLDALQASLALAARKLEPWRYEYRVQLPRRGLRWLRSESTPEPLAGGGVLWHGHVSDITGLKRVEEELRALSITDVLTGVYNRRYFQERLEGELARVARNRGRLALIMLDLDHFKGINDQFGHATGDLVLQQTCRLLVQRLRRSDVLCRLGGEEFVVLCPDIDDAQAYTLALELRVALQVDIASVGRVTASFGVAGHLPGEDADSLMLRVDAAVYAAKQAGRDRVERAPT